MLALPLGLLSPVSAGTLGAGSADQIAPRYQSKAGSGGSTNAKAYSLVINHNGSPTMATLFTLRS